MTEFGVLWPEHSKVSKICTLIGSYCAKYLKLQLKSIKVMQNLKKNWFPVSKWQEFGEFLSEHPKFSKVSTLIGSFCSKYITFDLKKYRGVIFDETDWKVMQNLKKNWLNGLENDIRNMESFNQSNWKCQNWDFDGILLPKVENVWD